MRASSKQAHAQSLSFMDQRREMQDRSCKRQLIPQLSIYGGKQKFSRKKSALIVGLLYISHSFSAWGDRMWGFIVSLLLLLLYPGSLLLPGIYGLTMQFTVAAFGTLAGNWVDSNPRMKVAWQSLLIQNGLVVLCSVGLSLMFGLQWNVCCNVTVFACLSAFVIVLASAANLATVANTIAIEKDWIVVLSDGNEDTLALLNANMRRIDLCCKLLAPALTGVFLQHFGPLYTTVIVGMWNVVSFIGELSLLWLVFRMVPTLAKKKNTKVTESKETLDEKDANGSDALLDYEEEDSSLVDEHSHVDNINQSKPRLCNSTGKICSNPVSTLIKGWKVYMKQEIVLVGFSMASIYLTVLGFSGVTATYFLTQGLRNDLIGVFQGVGAIFGVLGTIGYPFIRKRIGTIRTGLIGISTQLTMLLFCIAAVFVPSQRISSNASSYYAPDCSGYNESCGDMANTTSVYWQVSTIDCIFVTPTSSIKDRLTSTQYFSEYSMDAIVPSKVTQTPISTFRLSATTALHSRTQCQSLNSPSLMPTSPSSNHGLSIALVLMLLGIVSCRIGLWTFDLAVQQLVQEKVVEEERGVVSGVMNAMNSVMDMLHYVLVIAAPRPENFWILTLISVAMVAIGWLLYAVYVRKTRGHFFHFKDIYTLIKQKNVSSSISSHGSQSNLVQETLDDEELDESP